MTQQEQAALWELQTASAYYECLLSRKQTIMEVINRALDSRIPAWQNVVAWEQKRLRLICQELAFIEQEYGNALLISKRAPLWIQ